MTWAELLASNNVTVLPTTKAELDSLRSIVARSLSDVAATGLSTDQFEHEVCEEEPPIGSSLARVDVSRPLDEAAGNERFGLGSTEAARDKGVIQVDGHPGRYRV